MQVDLFDGQQHQADRPADEERGERADNELWPSQPAEQQSQNERKLDVSIPHTAFPDEGQYEVEHEQNQRAQDSASKPYPLPVPSEATASSITVAINVGRSTTLRMRWWSRSMNAMTMDTHANAYSSVNAHAG